jgi:hypothetical protein
MYVFLSQITSLFFKLCIQFVLYYKEGKKQMIIEHKTFCQYQYIYVFDVARSSSG